MLRIKSGNNFDLMYRKLLSQEPEAKYLVDQAISWFKKNPDDTRLDNHTLTGRMEGKWAFSITDDLRIVYEWLSKTTVRFLGIGGHKKVYKR